MRGRRRLRDREPVRLVAESTAGRVPPHNLDAEAAVLSAVLLGGEALDKVLPVLKPEHFYSDANGRIYEAAVSLAVANMPIDLVAVANVLRDRGLLAQCGGAEYLMLLSDATPAAANVGHHALIVKDKWRLRQLIAICQHTAAEGYGDVGEIQSFVSAHEHEVFELSQTAERTALSPLGAVLKSSFAAVSEAAARGARITGTSTGYEKIDAKTSGLHAGDLTIVAARPGMGKTAYVLSLAVNVASPREIHEDDGSKWTCPGEGVAVFSLEMPKDQCSIRMACSEGRVDLGRLRSGMMQPADWSRMTQAASYLSELPIWIDDTPAITLQEIRAKVRRLQAEYDKPESAAGPARKVGLVVIDYLQLMKGRDDAASRELEISEISRGLKQLAKELKVPVIALSQLNRSVETRSTKDKRPQLSDLRESGSIEQDADNVLFIYRDDYYNPETSNAKGLAEIIIAKQRNGPTGRVMLRFTASCTRFDNLAAGEYPTTED